MVQQNMRNEKCVGWWFCYKREEDKKKKTKKEKYMKQEI